MPLLVAYETAERERSPHAWRAITREISGQEVGPWRGGEEGAGEGKDPWMSVRREETP